MATREKKVSTVEKKIAVNRKNNTSSPQPPKEDSSSVEINPVSETPSVEGASSTKNAVSNKVAANKTITGSPSVKKLANKNQQKKVVNKPKIAIKLKPSVKKPIKPKMIKALMNNPKNAEAKNKLLKNCVKQVKPRKPKVVKNDTTTEENQPPVLEPIFPIDENIDTKPKKKGGKPPRIDNYAKKSEQLSVEDNSEKLKVDQTKTKRVYKRKPKTEPKSETIEDVMNDLSSIIKGSEIKQETDVLSESSKSDSVMKPKKVIRRRKKENIENALGTPKRNVIDMLDLNVQKVSNKGLSVTKRRHSIENFPMGSIDTDISTQTTLFPNPLSRCLSPRSKPIPKIRQSLDGFNRRANPYKTRSDSPARILRNGKHRKLKDAELLDGLGIIRHKRRRRNLSDFSGSEISVLSKSGYESDSSFSDLSSLHGAENSEPKDSIETVKSEYKDTETTEEFSTTAFKIDTDSATDDNSNVCKKDENMPAIPLKPEYVFQLDIHPLLKVPEKSIILDIMKQTFNDTLSEKDDKKQNKSRTNEPEVVNIETFYGGKEAKTEKNYSEAHPNEEIIFMKEDAGTVVIPSKSSEEISDNEDKVQDTNIVNDMNRTEVNENQNDQPLPSTSLQGDGSDNNDSSLPEETPEVLAAKENHMYALGLQSMKAAKERLLKNKERAELKGADYTGTLKTVIKLGRGERKKAKNMKMNPYYKSKTKTNDCDANVTEDKGARDGPSTSWKHSGQSSDTAGAHRKSHYSNRSNLDASSEHTSDGENGQEGPSKILVIPEKASSFSVHPGRLCKDECSYCFGRFGSLDTPCHIAQMKSSERQNKILANETHLTKDSCLCDACYRHVDRKSNTPSYNNKSYKRNALAAPGPRQNHCHVYGCCNPVTNILRRKWIIKMKKSILEAINLDLDNPGLHSIPICSEHYTCLEHLMVCAICKRRLEKNHVSLGPEFEGLQEAFIKEGIPITLGAKPIVCKLCKYFAGIIMDADEEMSNSTQTFIQAYKKRLLHFNDIEPMDEAAAEEPIVFPDRMEQSKKKRKLSKTHQSVPIDTGSDSVETEKSDQSRVPSTDSNNHSRPQSPSDYMVDYNTLIPSIALECGSDSETRREPALSRSKLQKFLRPESVKQAVEISKNMKIRNDNNGEIAVQKLKNVSVRKLFPCEEDLPLQGHIDFGNVKERTPEGWEKCTSIIQYDQETKHLWNELQKPYGNQSSFLRHLILLEKYFRNGDLILAQNANHHSLNYSESVQSRLKAYDNIPSNAGNVRPLSMLPFNKPQKSNSGIMTSTPVSQNKETPQSLLKTPTINNANIPKNTPITLSQLNSPPLIPVATTTTSNNPPRQIGSPPGLISLHPGTNRPIAPLIRPQQNRTPQLHKIKFPITKNWRPNLIPIDPNNPEKRAGLVQVVVQGKKYHISIEDYKKMCVIKKSFDAKQKQLQQAINAGKSKSEIATKSTTSKKSLVISKTSNNSKSDANDSENILEKLDKQVETLESTLNETKSTLTLPKIPKSLTVIPQTVPRKLSRPLSPVLLITQKPRSSVNKS